MRNPMPLAASVTARRTRGLLAAAMAAPVLLQLALHALAPLLPFGGAGAYAQVLAYAASGAAAVAGCVLVARLEAACRLRSGRKRVRGD